MGAISEHIFWLHLLRRQEQTVEIIWPEQINMFPKVEYYTPYQNIKFSYLVCHSVRTEKTILCFQLCLFVKSEIRVKD